MWIASIAYKELGCAEEHAWKKYGKLWYDSKENRASILLHGFRFGSFVAKPYANVKTPPYLCGEIVVWTGEYADTSTAIPKKRYMHVGHIQSCNNEKGTTYYGELRIDPMPCLMARQITKAVDKMGDDAPVATGVYLNVYLDNR
jgi:hypothetical protein